MKTRILVISLLASFAPVAQAACAVDIVGSWSVTHTSARAGAAREKEEMPSVFSFSRDGNADVQLGFLRGQSPYSCTGKSITLHKSIPSVLQVVSPGRREIALKEQGSGRIFYLRRN